MTENRADGAPTMPESLDDPTSPTGRPVRTPGVASGAGSEPPAPSDPADRLGLFDALSPLVTSIGLSAIGADPDGPDADDDPFQALIADIAIQKSREDAAPNGDHRRALLRAVAELAETHAVAADLACEETAIDLPLDVPEVAGVADPEGVGAKPVLVVPDMIRTCRDRLAAHMSEADRTRIDIVASLFDHVLSDDRLATGIRNTLARLQLPVLRMALADESFFLSRTHPTRRLLDRLEASAAEWQGDSPSARAGIAALERVVHKVIRGSYEDAGEHTVLLEQFERAIVDIATAASAAPVEVPPDSEDRDVLVIRTTIQLSQLLAGVEIDRTVRFFMLDAWSRVIVEIACRPADAARDALLARAKRLCFDIAWACAPKTTSGERARLAGLLPTMIAAIRDGLQVIDYPEEEERRFFSDWTRVLIQAVRSAPGTLFRASDVGLEGLTIDAFAKRLREGSFGPETMAGTGAGVGVNVDPLPGLKTEPDITPSMLRELGPITVPDTTPTQPMLPIETAKLEKGQWFDLRNGDVFNRVRLSWISPLRSFFLFIGTDSALTRSLDPGTISSMVARGDLKRATKRRTD